MPASHKMNIKRLFDLIVLCSVLAFVILVPVGLIRLRNAYEPYVLVVNPIENLNDHWIELIDTCIQRHGLCKNGYQVVSDLKDEHVEELNLPDSNNNIHKRYAAVLHANQGPTWCVTFDQVGTTLTLSISRGK